MRSYINQSLVHWTGRHKSEEEAFNILEQIITKKTLLLTYCPNYTDLPEEVRKRTMMVCFTDLHLNLSKEHCSLFGRIGIGFNKDTMIRYGANPVFYTTKTQLGRMHSFFEMLNRFFGLEIDREWKSEMEPYHFTSEQFYSALEISGFTQEYEYNESTINYYQREWRINYSTLPVTSGNAPQQPGDGSIYGRVNDKIPIACQMLFAKEDIDYIVVPEVFYEKGKQLVAGIDCEVKIYEKEVA